jgi:site-specific recombinase XerC
VLPTIFGEILLVECSRSGADETVLEPVYQGSRLRRMVEFAEKSRKTPIEEVSSPPQVRRVDRRLSAETMAMLVQAYRDGVGTPALRRRYAIS